MSSTEQPSVQVQEEKKIEAPVRKNSVGNLAAKLGAGFNPMMMMGGVHPKFQKKPVEEKPVEEKSEVVEKPVEQIEKPIEEEKSPVEKESTDVVMKEPSPTADGASHERMLHKKLDSFKKPSISVERRSRQNSLNLEQADELRYSKLVSPAVFDE